MDKLTEKLRNKILFALPELTLDEAEKIALINNCSSKTIYRWIKRMREGNNELNNITIAIAELAASKAIERAKNKNRLSKITMQLSAAPQNPRLNAQNAIWHSPSTDKLQNK